MQHIEWPVNIPVRSGITPLWHPGENRLYWCDSTAGKLYRLNPADDTVELCLEDRPVWAMTLQADGSLLLFRDQANIVIYKDGAVTGTVVNTIADFRHSQFSSAAADPAGRVICSVLSDSHHPGRLLRLDTTGRIALIDDNFAIPGGMAFDATGTRFFINDAHTTRMITWRYDYDMETGTLSEKRVFYNTLSEESAENGAPMGLAATSDGGILISRWGGAAVAVHDADGSKTASVAVPVKKPSGIAFGGASLDDVYISTSGGHRRSIEGFRAGGIARMKLDNITGIPLFRSRIEVN